MKNLALVVLVVVVAIVGYDFVNKPVENVEVAAVEEASVPVVNEESEVVENSSEDVATTEEEPVSMITPADLSEEAQTEMYTAIGEYNKCMMTNRLEYHQQGNNAEEVANKTLTACETHLDTLAATLLANNVNEGLRKGMVMTMRKRAARKLMSAVTQSLAAQAAAAANAVPVAPEVVPVTTP
ncbi:MAG: hypothetical protein GQ548_05815 [Methylophaga sp.]|nr:hypothetical protein [Methylophaga sp.]